MPAHRTKPEHCIVPECVRPADVDGTARGYCVLHYTRWRRYGWCEANDLRRGPGIACGTLATNHLGLCNQHTPAGVPV